LEKQPSFFIEVVVLRDDPSLRVTILEQVTRLNTQRGQDRFIAAPGVTVNQHFALNLAD
jgi:hypothetical protein